ncbi:MAG: ligase-associated DNA damage response endonuclease PdeM [Chthoniobacter sp.]|nr:ligase-associated DNA damage response endonuclease PdeM [Chthoniobacter sp.]
MSIETHWAGERLILLADKAIVWSRTASLIVADPHFGKPAAFRMAGIPVPESTTASDLERLDELLRTHRNQRLIILGDFFHSAAGLQPAMMDTIADWRSQNASLEIVLVPGNHDKSAGEPPASWNIRLVPDGWSLPPFSFCHEPRDIPTSHVLAGHLHPAISLREKFGGGIRVPCFWFRRTCAVLPAFGSFTGTHAVRPTFGDQIFAVGDGEIVEVTA